MKKRNRSYIFCYRTELIRTFAKQSENKLNEYTDYE